MIVLPPVEENSKDENSITINCRRRDGNRCKKENRKVDKQIRVLNYKITADLLILGGFPNISQIHSIVLNANKLVDHRLVRELHNS